LMMFLIVRALTRLKNCSSFQDICIGVCFVFGQNRLKCVAIQ
jgi:hypothetical protein